jgi:autotransporter-associated beta strand protein
MKLNMQKTSSRRNARLNALIIAAIVSIICLFGANARAQFTWPVYEPFGEYTNVFVTNNGTMDVTNIYLLGDDASSSNYWNFGNGNSYWEVTNGAAMSWPGLVGDPNPNPKGIQEIPENTTSADKGATFTPQVGTNIYASFLLNYQDNGGATGNRSIFNIVTNAVVGSSDTHIFASVWLTPDYGIEIDKNVDGGGTLTSEVGLATNAPVLIVVRYKVVAGGNDEFDLWVNPGGLGNNGLIPTPTLSTTNGPNLTPGFNGVELSQRLEGGNYWENVFQIDEIRLANDWATVTPATTSPGTLFGMTGGGSTCAGTPLNIGVNGSMTADDYLLYTNGVYSGESLTGIGSALSFGGQTTPAFYTVLESNTTTTAVGWTTNTVAITVIPPPVILTEPIPATSAANFRAEFKTTVSGSGFAEQWYLNNIPVTNSSNIAGALTNDLVITNANATNVGNYYCSISNSCGEISYTTTNSLTLDSPNNLIWAGDQFSINNWNVGANAALQEFTSGGTPTYFNEGDNVTFNDTYNGSQYGSTITLSNTLTPSSITYNTSQNLTFAGPGTISGTGSLLVNDSGTLTFGTSTANTFSGGTVISNGDVNIPNSWASIGTGPLTLAGGTFETDQKSGTGAASTLGFLTNIFVTASSTWQVDKTGTQCAGCAAGLFGNPGTTLTISNSATTVNSANWIRFGGCFTNYAAIVALENPVATGSSMQIGTYNVATNVQVYDGSISGATCVFNAAGAGSVYLNAANTYPSNTVVTAGFLGGSGSIAGPLLVTNSSIGGGSQIGIGTFTVNSFLSFSNANVLIRVNKSLVQSNDLISVTGMITNNGAGTGTGTVTITNIGSVSLAVGDTFQVFNKAVTNGATMTVTGGGSGVTWNNNLAVNGSVQVATIPVPLLTNSPTIISFTLQGGNVAIGATNGTAGANAYLLMGTNITEPLNQWLTVATDSIGSGSFSFTATNAVTAGSAQQYYILSSTNNNN